MELTTTHQPARFLEAKDATDRGVDAMPDDTSFERYEHTAMEANIAPVAFDERIDLETRVYSVVLGVMSFGGIGWVCLCIGAGLNFLLS